jgi:hypothetical protein
MAQSNGGPAFPAENETLRAGMSLRDYFAAKALPSVIAAYLTANGNGCAADHALRNVPALAYRYADAMLAEREK